MRRRRAGRTGTIQRALRRSWWRQGLAWLAPRWLSMLCAVALFGLALSLLTSPELRVQQVVVRRESASAQAALTRATQLSHVVGQNILLLNTHRVAREVASVPSVLSARVVPRFPNTVEIEIVERSPIAVWRAANGSFLVDAQGFVIAEAPEGNGLPSFSVKDTTGREFHLADQVNPRLLHAGRELSKALPAAGASVREVEAGPQGLVLVTDGGWRVLVGEPDSLNTKLANFAAVVELAQSRNLKIQFVDLRPKDRPFYQLAP
jgi:cell division protein FtsQ